MKNSSGISKNPTRFLEMPKSLVGFFIDAHIQYERTEFHKTEKTDSKSALTD